MLFPVPCINLYCFFQYHVLISAQGFLLSFLTSLPQKINYSLQSFMYWRFIISEIFPSNFKSFQYCLAPHLCYINRVTPRNFHLTVAYLGQSIQEWTKKNFLKAVFHKFTWSIVEYLDPFVLVWRTIIP